MWASAFLLPWAGLFIARPELRRSMLWASALTAPFGLTEPLFVPSYWNPPSLFDLAQRTGFDIESLIFCYAIGGIGIASYRALVPSPLVRLDHHARSSPRHRWHFIALASPFLIFISLLPFKWMPIYPGIIAMAAGAVATLMCRPDLWRNMLFGGSIFLTLYAIFLLGLKWIWPGYIAAVWNFDALVAWHPAGLPIEELLFGFAFGMYWSSIYEHITWRQFDSNKVRNMMRQGSR
ncbi:MAG: hypothetical protein KJ852_12265 [Gammaproteobacteria bacterium]|nr:hypothetical protein [Gammaproteobacteria bacterium]MBU0786546.1 hypothetical protein [Gammaproteobacteria bacterium]MBU0817154.1 hypothetical protein [Gammaproteobacteria bacterium]MBU1787725.1 hypothetical protein [Gammaproteobacteria bacterium]